MSTDLMMEAWIESSDDEPGLATWPGGDDPYHAALREAFAPEYRTLPAPYLDGVVEQAFADLPELDAESFGSFLQGVGRAIAPIAAKVIPVAAPIVGTAIGGPAGMAIGGAVGQLAGRALGAPAPVGATVQVPAQAPGAVAATPTADAGASSAIGQLLSLLQHPALGQSLLGQVLGPAGAKAVPVGPAATPAPFAAFMNALSVLANRAASESAERFGEASEAESTGYLRDDTGDFVFDPASAEDRADALLEQLRASRTPGAMYAPAPWEDASMHEREAVADWFARAGLVR